MCTVRVAHSREIYRFSINKLHKPEIVKTGVATAATTAAATSRDIFMRGSSVVHRHDECSSGMCIVKCEQQNGGESASNTANDLRFAINVF